MSTGSVSGAGQQTGQSSAITDAWSSVNLESFVNLLVTELQNQDPMEPMDSAQILQQISQIREIESNQRLTNTLEAVSLGQQLATAGNMLGHTITGLSDTAETVTGIVDRITIEDGKARLHVGEDTISMQNVREIISEGEQAE